MATRLSGKTTVSATAKTLVTSIENPEAVDVTRRHNQVTRSQN